MILGVIIYTSLTHSTSNYTRNTNKMADENKMADQVASFAGLCQKVG
jgi:hypothetical protein